MESRLRISRSRLDDQLQNSIAKGGEISKLPQDSSTERQLLLQSFRSWDEFNRRLLEQAFTPVSWHQVSPKSQYTNVEDITFMPVTVLSDEQVSSLIGLVGEKVRKLESLRASLDLYEEPDEMVNVRLDSSNPAAVPEAIFLVHGRDDAARLRVQQVIEKATPLKVVVLANQPNQGQTIIEKLEGHFENSAFAVVLMTADDEGRLKSDTNLQPRARQNVVLELGYAAAKLGRRNIAVLVEDGIEMPSDFHGFGHTPFDSSDGWILKLLGEMNSAGIKIDPLRVLS